MLGFWSEENRDRYRVPEVNILRYFPQPETLDDILLAEPWKSRLLGWLRNLDTMPPAVLLYGAAGCGKTTIPRILSKTPGYIPFADYFQFYGSGDDDCKIFYVNCSQVKNGVNALHEALDLFCSPTFSAKRSMLIADEAHDLTQRAVNVLKEAAEGRGGKLLLLSTKNKIGDEQLMTRLITMDIGNIDVKAFLRKTVEALKKHGISYDAKALKKLWLTHESPRHFLNQIEYNIIDGKLMLED